MTPNLSAALTSRVPDSGIAACGALAWGTHLCHFARDDDERMDILLAYFSAGVRDNEAGFWIVADRADYERTQRALAALPALREALEAGQVELCTPEGDPLPAAGRFFSDAVLDAWMERFRRALAAGRSGLRIAGNTVWAAHCPWPAFLEHERRIKEAFARSRVLCLCSYNVDEHDAEDVLGVARLHDLVLAGRAADAEVLSRGTLRTAREESLDSQLTQARRELDDRTQDLDAALNSREEFLALLGHELRNPLGPLRNAARIVRMTSAPDPAVQQATDVIDRHVNQLSRLVDDLLDLGRLTRGTMSLVKDEVQLDGIIASALQVARPLIEYRRQELILSLPQDTLSLNADGVRLAQVFSNLLDNASVYTPRGGRIWLSAAYEDGAAVVRIRDNGVGIPPHLLSRIFALFVQGPRRPDRADGGLGIGLALVKRLVELHGGTVQAFSEGEGRGSEFVVRLPVLAVVHRSDAARPAGSAEPARARLRVLVVDDHLDSNEMLAQLLTMHGHEVRRETNGPAALEAAKAFFPDAVLLDIGLPGMDGYEVARQLRRIDAARGANVIAITGYGSSRDLRESSQAGIDHHLVKPVEPDRLLGILDGITPRAPVLETDKVRSIGARLRRAFTRSGPPG